MAMKNYLIGDYNPGYKYSQMMGKYGAEGFAPAIITCAITGGMHGKEANPNLPETLDEQVQAAVDAYNAGASMVHIHRREPDNLAVCTDNYELYLEVNARIREKCPDLIINNTAMGGRFYYEGEPGFRNYALPSTGARPEVTSIDLFTTLYLLPGRPRTAYTMHATDCIDVIKICEEHGVKPEFECTSVNDLKVFNGLIAKHDCKDKPYWFQLLVNGQGTLPSPTAISEFASQLPENSMLGVIGIGASQFPVVAMGLAMGHNVRVGLEDNVYYRKGELATSNAQLVERAVRLAKEIGRPIATPAQAREMMGLGAPRQYTYPAK